jgi:hypothetical protein
MTHSCSPSCRHLSWSEYGARKPARLQRPERPVPICSYPTLEAIVAERVLRYGDGHDALVYGWEAQVEQIFGLDREPLLTLDDGQIYIDKLWRTYASELSPFFSAPPTLILEPRSGAVASCLEHTVRIGHEYCRRSWLAHETIHLCIPEEQHGPRWRRAMIGVWAQEFMIAPELSRELAREAGLEEMGRRKGQPRQLSLMLR